MDTIEPHILYLICLLSIIDLHEDFVGWTPIIIITNEAYSIEPPLSQVLIGSSKNNSCLINNKWIMLLNSLQVVFMVSLWHNNEEGLLSVEEIVKCNDYRDYCIDKWDKHGSYYDWIVNVTTTCFELFRCANDYKL